MNAECHQTIFEQSGGMSTSGRLCKRRHAFRAERRARAAHRVVRFFCLALLAFLVFPLPSFGSNIPSKKEITRKLIGLSIPFVANEGQIDRDIAYYARTFAGTIYVTKEGSMTYSLRKGDRRAAFKEEVSGVNNPVPIGQEPSVTKISSFKGNDPSKWRSNISSFNTVSLGEIKPGIILSLKAHGNNVEKVFTVNPGTTPSIFMKLSGIRDLNLTETGELEVMTGSGSSTFTKPVAYQEVEGNRVYVPIAYMLGDNASEWALGDEPEDAGRIYGFAVGTYDTAKPLTIDPLLASTFLGGSRDNCPDTIILDLQGNVFVAGYTDSLDFPTTEGAYRRELNGVLDDVFIVKMDSALASLLSGTYIGGTGDDLNSGIALDTLGNLYIAGLTFSRDFPTTEGAYDRTLKGMPAAFIAKLDNSLTSLLASTYFGGSGANRADGGVVLDRSGNVYVAGVTTSPDFPTTKGAYQRAYYGGMVVFISKFDSSLAALRASTLLGGDATAGPSSLALDPWGNVYVAGSTSGAFPTTKDAYQRWHHGEYLTDGFISKLDNTLGHLLASTYLGGEYEDGVTSLALGPSGDVYVGGWTYSPDFPTSAGAFMPAYQGYGDAFISRLDSSLTTLLASTYLGGTGYDTAGIILDPLLGTVYATGYTGSTDFPTTEGAYSGTFNGGDWDAFISRLDPSLGQFFASTYLGGNDADAGWDVALDPSGNVYVAGTTGSHNFPTTEGAYDRTWHTGFISKLDPNFGTPGEYFPLTVYLGGNQKGSVTGQYLVCGQNPCPGVYVSGASITLTASATQGSSFQEWVGCDTTTGNVCALTMNTARTVTAVFLSSPRISVRPRSINFGTIGHASPSKVITIKNNGSADLTITGLAFTGPNASEFTETDTCAQPVVKGGSCVIVVQIVPTSYEKKSAVLTIPSNDPEYPSITVDLKGTASPPKISVSPGSMNFGTLSLGKVSTKKITLKNNGPADLMIGSITLDDPYSRFSVSHDCSVLPKGTTCVITTTFTPVSVGPATANIAISSTDPAHPSVEVGLKGKGK